jgi:putative ABC transport system permease protein
MPESPDECLIDGDNVTDAVLGTTFTIVEENEQATLDSFHYRTFTVVGYVSTPLYMDLSRGSTSIGSGVVTSYVYLPKDAFHVDYFTEIDITLEGEHTYYSEEYDQLLKDMAEQLKPGVTLLAGERLTKLKADALVQYEDGLKEYEDGLREYESARAETLASLGDGLKELEKAQKEIDENRKKLENGKKELEKGQKELDKQSAALQDGLVQLSTEKAKAYAQLAAAYEELLSNRTQANDALAQVRDGIKQIDAGMVLLDDGIA